MGDSIKILKFLYRREGDNSLKIVLNILSSQFLANKHLNDQLIINHGTNAKHNFTRRKVNSAIKDCTVMVYTIKSLKNKIFNISSRITKRYFFMYLFESTFLNRFS